MRNKIRRLLSDYNADRRDLFTAAGLKYLQECKAMVSPVDWFVLRQLLAEWKYHREEFKAISSQLKAWAILR